MKPVIIKKEVVMEELFKGNEVLHISFQKNGNVKTDRLTRSAISTIKDIVSNAGNSEFFICLTEEAQPETPEQEK